MKYGFPILWAVVSVTAVALVVAAETVSPEVRRLMIREGGIVETLSAAGYLAAASLLFWQAITHHNRWYLAVATLCLGMRELDFHKRFTTMSVFKARFYSGDEVPGLEKLFGVLILLALLACVGLLLKKHARGFIEGLKVGDGVSRTVLMVFMLLICSKSLDGLGRKLGWLGIEVSEAGRQLSGSTEEVMEMAAAILLLSAVVGTMKRSAKGRLPAAETLPGLQRSK